MVSEGGLTSKDRGDLALGKGMEEDVAGGGVVVSKGPEPEIKCSLGGGLEHATRVQPETKEWKSEHINTGVWGGMRLAAGAGPGCGGLWPSS